jgi:hypothetical protein
MGGLRNSVERLFPEVQSAGHQLSATVNSRRWISTLLMTILLLSVPNSVLVSGSSRNGNFTFTMSGYTVAGDLTNAIITHEGAVQLQMLIDQTITVPNATVHIIGSGIWNGKTDFATFKGSIGSVKGTVQACLQSSCQSANFTGTGIWEGTLSWSRTFGSQGSGTFQGTLNLTGPSPTPTNLIPVSGSWTATFAI